MTAPSKSRLHLIDVPLQAVTALVTILGGCLLVWPVWLVWNEFTGPGYSLDGNTLLAPIKASTNVVMPIGVLLNVVTWWWAKKMNSSRRLALANTCVFGVVAIATLAFSWWLFHSLMDGSQGFRSIVWWL